MIVLVVAVPVAVLVTATALRASASRAEHRDARRRTIEALLNLRAVAEAGGALPYAADALVEVLHLLSCRYEPHPAGEAGVPVLGRDGAFDVRIQRRDRRGAFVPDTAHLAVASGRFALTPHPERSTTLEERLVAVAIASIARAAVVEERART